MDREDLWMDIDDEEIVALADEAETRHRETDVRFSK